MKGKQAYQSPEVNAIAIASDMITTSYDKGEYDIFGEWEVEAKWE